MRKRSDTPLAPTAEGCPITALPDDVSSTPNERAPNLRNRFGRSVYLIKPSEMADAGIASGTSFSAIGWSFQTAPGLTGSNTLVVYLQNTSDTTNTKSTSWAAAISGMTVVSSGAVSIPNVTGPWDIAFSGGSPFNYTGGGLYVAFDAQYPVGTLSTTTAVWCNSTGLANGLLGGQGSTAPTTLTASSFRPETRLTPAVATIYNDAGVDAVISFGSVPQSLTGPQIVQAVITNKGLNPISNLPVTLSLTGAQTSTDTQTLTGPLAACGGQGIVTFAPLTLTATASDTLTVSVPPDDFSGNNTRSRPLDSTFNLYSYKHPGTAATGGVGFSGATGDLVAKFTTTVPVKITAINLEFFSAGATYRAAIYPDSGNGTPGFTPTYQDSFDRTAAAGPVTIALSPPLAVGPGSFFAGIQQTGMTNASLSFDAETPIRAGAFYLATPHPPSAWSDESPGNSYKLNVGVTAGTPCAGSADCDDHNACTDDACSGPICVHANNSATSCDGNSCSSPDQCVNGVCIPGPNPCNDNNPCTVDLCNAQGACYYQPASCDDGNPCTADGCTPSTGCTHAAMGASVQVCNHAGIMIPSGGAASPYPSTVVVTGQPSYLCSATVDLDGFAHTYPSDVDVLLARLSGANALILSDVGGSVPVSGVDLTLSDAAASPLPITGPLVSGTYKPTNYGAGDVFPAPAPAPTGGSALSIFTGTNPNGTWSLWVDDQFSPDGGRLDGWCLNLVSVCVNAADCDDGNICTTEACTGGLCSHANNTNPCDDNNACTSNDRCSNGVCAGGPPAACDDGNACTANNCNPQTGQCENPPIVCDDDDSCTDDSCDPATGCVFTPNDQNACSDNSLCTDPDVCRNGVCVGQNPVYCPPDANVCTTETCDPSTGQCITLNNTDPCDDGNACTVGDACGPTLSESFDGVVAPALPGAWASGVVAGTGNPWTTVSTSSDTAPNSAFGFDGPAVADEVLVTPPLSIGTASASLTFRNRWSFEAAVSYFDGSVLEISINGAGFTDIVTAGGSFSSGGYTGTISSSFGNPLGGRPAWAGTSTGYPAYLTTTVQLPAAAAGTMVQLRWRLGTDASSGAPGQNIDSVLLRDGTNVCKPGAVTLDCNDGNPCTDDGCNPATGCVFTPVTPPPETHNVLASANKTTYSWAAAVSATRYDVVRGATGGLPVGPGGADEVCFDNLPGPSVDDPAVPAPGSGFWYLSRGENSCGIGTLGAQSNGTQRSTATCP